MNDLTPDEIDMLILALDTFYVAHIEQTIAKGRLVTFCACCRTRLYSRRKQYTGHTGTCIVRQMDALRKRLVKAKAHAK